MKLNIGAKYRRLHGNRKIVTIVGILDGHIKLKDDDGIHFVSMVDFNTRCFEVV